MYGLKPVPFIQLSIGTAKAVPFQSKSLEADPPLAKDDRKKNKSRSNNGSFASLRMTKMVV
jgi:hypothetical protein